VVLLNIGLPKLSGYDVCRHIREQLWGKTWCWGALTGWGLEEDRRESKDAGFDHHLVKPMDFEALRGLLAEVP
jgi:DNA-binding response OmpR family regulator